MNELVEYMLNTIKDVEIKEYARKCIDIIPDYWYHVPASSSGKYHPSYALGEGGLLRHTCAVVKMLNHMFDVDCIGIDFSDREKDLLRVAAIMHDAFKSGTQEEWEENPSTKFMHPEIAANKVGVIEGLPYGDVYLIFDAIRSHMGAWNTSKYESGTLRKPRNKFQKILHLADYLASRKDIEILF